MTGHPDFFVVVKNRGRPPQPWKWAIYRAGRKSPIKQSDDYFSTVTDTNRAGSKAIKLFLSEFQDEVPELIKFARSKRMSHTQVLLVLMVFLAELPPLAQVAPAQNPVTMDSIKAGREKRETPRRRPSVPGMVCI
jgi:hypothetical protein